MSDRHWRTEADDVWAAERRSRLMVWLRRRFRFLGGIAGAVSYADTGPYAGAPRDPHLRVDGDKGYSTVRHTTSRVANITISAVPDACPRCGLPMVERHDIEYVSEDLTRASVGAARACRNCEADSWLRRSHLPNVSRARETARKNVV